MEGSDPELANQPRGRSRRRPAEVRQQLLEATERVVIEKGLAVTAQDIASESGIHRTVLQRHFPDIGELIREAALRPFREFLAVMQSRAEKGQPGTDVPTWDLTRDLVAEMTTNFLRHRAFITRVLADRSVLGDANWAMLQQTLDTLIDSLAPLTEEQMRSRGFTPESMRIKSRLALAMIAGIASHGDWILPQAEDSLPFDRLIDEICDFALYGTRSESAAAKKRDRKPPQNHTDV
ncbi:TetR/AcrR family transcriptional regulator [Mycobacterium sp. GA-2829]|uniref:TetR/AcrR family transcriptional regulator n=1 Tax=Mycobacterium sp. GA-2829 TaxID=1772283 RepID=UPI00073FC4EC|nr:TetR/AcrR family transcriptional regulator [Mycobacterium sp. GA-2829]KUI29276.1 hypothetical protein AU194_20600 [Mycobacterium sp. GA-2829]